MKTTQILSDVESYVASLSPHSQDVEWFVACGLEVSLGFAWRKLSPYI